MRSPLLLVLGLCFSACSASTETAAPPAGLDARTALTGLWDWEGEAACQSNPHFALYDAERQLLILNYTQSLTGATGERQAVYRYDVTAAAGNSITGVMQGDNRLTAAGEPVVWTLTMFAPDVYRWRQTDWPEGRYTRAMVRCPARQK